MKVKMLTAIAGPQFTYAAGEVVEIPDAEAQEWQAAGVCAFAESLQQVQEAPKAEAAQEPKPAPKKRGRPPRTQALQSGQSQAKTAEAGPEPNSAQPENSEPPAEEPTGE